MAASANVPTRMTVAEFLAWDSPAGAIWQLVDGEPRAMAPASPNRLRPAISDLTARSIGFSTPLAAVYRTTRLARR